MDGAEEEAYDEEWVEGGEEEGAWEEGGEEEEAYDGATRPPLCVSVALSLGGTGVHI